MVQELVDRQNLGNVSGALGDQYTLTCILHVMQAELVLLETTECINCTYTQSPTTPKAMVSNHIEMTRPQAAHVQVIVIMHSLFITGCKTECHDDRLYKLPSLGRKGCDGARLQTCIYVMVRVSFIKSSAAEQDLLEPLRLYMEPAGKFSCSRADHQNVQCNKTHLDHNKKTCTQKQLQQNREP